MLENILKYKGIHVLKKNEQSSIHGGFRPPCYDAPTTDVNCISPWVYFTGCGWMCKTAPTP